MTGWSAPMRGDVALARRNLQSDPRRLAVGVLGVGLAVALMLLVEGLWQGTLRRITVYEDNVRAELFVGERGTKTFLSDVSAVPLETAVEIRSLPGVDTAAPIAVRQLIVDEHGMKIPVMLIGAEAESLGGPWGLTEGRAPATDREVVIDEGFAGAHAYRVGDELELLGERLRVVGLTPDSRALGNGGPVFVSLGAAARLVGSESPSFVLVRTGDPAGVGAAIRSQTGLEVLTPDQMAAGDRALYDDTMGSVIRVMLAIAFAAGTLIVALSVYSSVVDRIREYGIVKALGAGRRRLFRIVVSQTGSLALLGGALGLAVFAVAKAALTLWLPEFHVELPGAALVAATGAVAAMALLAAVLPVRRIARLDPASVYRGEQT